MTTMMTKYLLNFKKAFGNDPQYNDFSERIEDLLNVATPDMQELVSDFVEDKLKHNVENMPLYKRGSFEELLAICENPEKQDQKYREALEDLHSQLKYEYHEEGLVAVYLRLWGFAFWFKFSPEEVEGWMERMNNTHTSIFEYFLKFFHATTGAEVFDDTACDYIAFITGTYAEYAKAEGQALGLGCRRDKKSIVKRIEKILETDKTNKLCYLFSDASILLMSYEAIELKKGYKKFNELNEFEQTDLIQRYRRLQKYYCMA